MIFDIGLGAQITQHPMGITCNNLYIISPYNPLFHYIMQHCRTTAKIIIQMEEHCGFTHNFLKLERL